MMDPCLISFVWISLTIILLGHITAQSLPPTNCSKVPPERCDRQCAAILWQTCMETSNEISNTERDLEREADENLPLRLALNFSRQNEHKAENLARNFSDIPVHIHEVFLLMAYTYESPDNETEPFYRDINRDMRDHGISGGKYPVTKYLLRDVLIRIGRKRPLTRKLYRHEPAIELQRYIAFNKSKLEITFAEFTSVSSKQDAYGCEDSHVRVEFLDYRAAVNMRPFSVFPQEQEVLFPPFHKSAFVQSIDEKKNRVVMSGPGTEQNFPPCSSSTGSVVPTVSASCLLAVTFLFITT